MGAPLQSVAAHAVAALAGSPRRFGSAVSAIFRWEPAGAPRAGPRRRLLRGALGLKLDNLAGDAIFEVFNVRRLRVPRLRQVRRPCQGRLPRRLAPTPHMRTQLRSWAGPQGCGLGGLSRRTSLTPSLAHQEAVVANELEEAASRFARDGPSYELMPMPMNSADVRRLALAASALSQTARHRLSRISSNH